jgi:arginine/ornithine N-succinyltransferase beta subunit
MNPTRFLFRAAGPADIDAFERAAADSVIGITTLPADRARLAERLERSAAEQLAGHDRGGAVPEPVCRLRFACQTAL